MTISQFALKTLQDAELLVASYPIHFPKERQRQINLANCLLIRSDVFLKHDVIARQRLDPFFEAIKGEEIITIAEIDAILVYIFLLMDKNNEQYAQQIFLWSQRALDLITDPRRRIISSDRFVSDAQILAMQARLRRNISKYLLCYQEKLKTDIAQLPFNISYDLQKDMLCLAFSRKLSPKELSTCSVSNILFEFGEESVTIKDASKIEEERLRSCLHQELPDILKLVEETIQKSYASKVKAKAKKKKARTIKKLKNTVPAAVVSAASAATLVAAPATSVEEIQPSLQALTLESFPEKFAKRKITKESSEVTVSPLTLTSPDFAGLKLIKFQRAIGLYLSFKDFTFKKSKVPDDETIDRFVALCQEPKLVGPKNENGFKWICTSKSRGPILIGKIASLPWRLLPIASESTPQGTAILYGKMKQVKSGKRSLRYQ